MLKSEHLDSVRLLWTLSHRKQDILHIFVTEKAKKRSQLAENCPKGTQAFWRDIKFVGLRWTALSRLCIYASPMGIWEFDFLFMISLELKCLTEIGLLFVDCFN